MQDARKRLSVEQTLHTIVPASGGSAGNTPSTHASEGIPTSNPIIPIFYNLVRSDTEQHPNSQILHSVRMSWCQAKSCITSPEGFHFCRLPMFASREFREIFASSC
jgi:hypothetical protein